MYPAAESIELPFEAKAPCMIVAYYFWIRAPYLKVVCYGYLIGHLSLVRKLYIDKRSTPTQYPGVCAYQNVGPYRDEDGHAARPKDSTWL